MRRKEALQTLDIMLEELLSTKEGTEVYLQCLLRATKAECTPRKYNQIAKAHLELLQQVIQGE